MAVLPFIFTLTTSTLSTGLVLDATGLLHGMPTQAGAFLFTVMATAATSFTATQTYTFTITAPMIALAPTGLPNGAAEHAYSAQTVITTGGIAPYPFGVMAGSLRTGLTLNPVASVLSDISTQVESFPFTVSAMDENTFTGTRSYTIILPVPTGVLTPTSLPDEVKGVAYSATTMNALVGNTLYTFTINIGALPGGLVLNPTTATLSGTPIALSTFSFTATVTGATMFIGTQATYGGAINTNGTVEVRGSISPSNIAVGGNGGEINTGTRAVTNSGVYRRPESTRARPRSGIPPRMHHTPRCGVACLDL